MLHSGIQLWSYYSMCLSSIQWTNNPYGKLLSPTYPSPSLNYPPHLPSSTTTLEELDGEPLLLPNSLKPLCRCIMLFDSKLDKQTTVMEENLISSPLPLTMSPLIAMYLPPSLSLAF